MSNKFWKSLKQNLRSYCRWSCFKPVVLLSKIKENPSTMKMTSTNAATGSSYSNMSVDERDQMLKEAILYCKQSMNKEEMGEEEEMNMQDWEKMEMASPRERIQLMPLNAKEISRNDVSDWECINDNNTINTLQEQSASAYSFAQRRVGETTLNETIPRLACYLHDVFLQGVNFVDLAGIKRAYQALSADTRLKEGCHINGSLLTLGTVVIRKLSKGRTGHVPYRDSKLTRILQPSLGGNARTDIICSTSHARDHVEQSRNTLLFASCTPKFAGRDPNQCWDRNPQGTSEDTEDLCKEVGCIEMEESSTNRNVDSLTCLSPEEASKEGISSLTMVANGDLTYQQEPLVASSANTNGELSVVPATDSTFCFRFPKYIANGDLTYQEPVVASSANTNGELSVVPATDSTFCFRFPQYIY